MAQEQTEPTDGLTPMGIQRLRSLRRENTALRAQVVTLEQALEKEQIEHHLDTELLTAAPKPPPATVEPASRPPGEQKSETEPSGPGSVESPPSSGKRRKPIDWHSGETRKRMAKTAGNTLFYMTMALILAGAFMARGARQGTPINIGGYSGMLVLTESMQDVIPKGSLILTKSVPAEELAVGDDISYMVNPTTSVTHRIISIHPQGDGSLSFRTEGLHNPTPDSSIVPEYNVVGKVIYHSLFLGLLAKGVSDNWPLLLFLLGIWIALGWVLARIWAGKPQGKRIHPRRSDLGKSYRFIAP